MTDGGPGFPTMQQWENSGGSLRAYIATHALAGMLVGVAGMTGGADGVDEFTAYARGHCNASLVGRAVAVADALLAELAKGQK